MISYISLFEIISAVMPDPKIFFWIDASVADAVVVNSKDTKTLLPNGVSTLFINGKPAVINGLYIQSIILSYFALKQNKLWNTFTILSWFLVKNLKWWLLLLK